MSFQFTHPGKGATRPTSAPRRTIVSFNSRTPGGVRPYYDVEVYSDLPFQFTHPGRGATRSPMIGMLYFSAFQFTHPGRGATLNTFRGAKQPYVSIHAPREGCDVHQLNVATNDVLFQFTHPGRGATRSMGRCPASMARFNSRTPGGVRLTMV